MKSLASKKQLKFLFESALFRLPRTRKYLSGICLSFFVFIGFALSGCIQNVHEAANPPSPLDYIKQGERFYEEQCRSCHGKEGDRIPAAPIQSAAFLESRSDATLLAVILDGKGVMPAFGKHRDGPFEERDAQALLAYLNSTAKRESSSILAETGKNVFSSNCVSCHGSKGDRIPIAPLNAKGFLDSRTDSVLYDTISKGKGIMPSMAQTSGGPLDDQNVKAVISYLRFQVDKHMAQLTSKGRDLYMSSCLQCHGEMGDRIPAVRLASAEYLQKLGEGRVVSAIYSGTGSMPGFGQEKGGLLGIGEVAALMSYLKSWAGLSAASALPGPENGGQGKDIFARQCASCHGQTGDRVPGVQLKSLEFLNTRTDKVILQTIREGHSKGMPAWSKALGGPLEEEQITSILDYLKSAASSSKVSKVDGISAPTSAAAKTDSSAEMVAKGKDLFQKGLCFACHKATRDGIPTAKLTDPAWLESRGDDALFRTISEGRGGMPAWGKAKGGHLEDADIKAIIAYLKDEVGAGGKAAPAAAPKPAASLELAAKGKDLFQKGPCIGCHRPSRDGIPTAKLTDPAWLESKGDDSLFRTISEGRGGMPAWGKAKGGHLEDADIKAIIAYLKDEAGAGKDSPEIAPSQGKDNSPAPGPRTGKEIFETICFNCHGTDGLRILQAPLGAKQWLYNISQDDLVARISRGKPSSGMPTWSKKLGGPLSDEEIVNVATYLPTVAK